MTHQNICERLKRIERDYGVRILYAVENGSRAWGFDSADSDWDVRYICVHPLEWYLKVWPSRKDVIEVTEGDFESSGWDLRKALSLYLETNPSMLEWLFSPIVYMDDGILVSKLKELLPNYFNVFNAVYHYYSIAKRQDAHYLIKHGYNLKRFVYYLRGLLACSWLIKQGTPPPVPFEELVNGTVKDPEILTSIDSLLERKKTGRKHDKDEVDPILIDFGQTLYEEADKFLSDRTLPVRPSDKAKELDRLLYEMALATK